MQDINQKSCIMHHESLKIKAPAKINLGLRIKGLRPDGFHEIETTMQMVGLFDELTFEKKDNGIELITEGEAIPTGKENIVYKAFLLLTCMCRQEGKAKGRGVRIILNKKIPVAAGLGGGSSDAAATLFGLNRLWDLGLKRKALIDLGRRLGSDVPFFLFEPSALAMGRGNILTPIRPLDAWVLLINPGFPVSTSWAYKNYEKVSHGGVEDPGTFSGLTKGADNIKLPRLKKNRYTNDLEKVTIKRYPEIEKIKGMLMDSGAKIALMSGSGPTVFGVFSEKRLAEDASKRFKGYRVYIVKTLTKSPLI